MKSPSHGKLWSTCHCLVTVQSLKLYRVKVVDSLQSFSITIRHQSINELCLTLSLCKCYKWMLNKARNQTKIFKLNRSLTTPRSQSLFKSLNELPLEPQKCLTKSSCTCSSYSTGQQFFEIQSTIDQRAHQQHRYGVKIVFINRTIITYNLVSMYALLEIRVHFKRIKIVFINRTTITYNLVSIYPLLEIWAHFERINNIGMAWETERD